MAYVNVDVEVDLSAFDDDDILDAALDIVRREVKEGGRRSALCAAPIEALRQVLFQPEGHDEEPLSTAARLRDMAALRRFVEVESKGLFQFATPTKDTPQ